MFWSDEENHMGVTWGWECTAFRDEENQTGVKGEWECAGGTRRFPHQPASKKIGPPAPRLLTEVSNGSGSVTVGARSTAAGKHGSRVS